MNENNFTNYLKIYLKSLIRGFLLTIILLVIASIIFFFTDLKESFMGTVSWIVTIISICYGSIYSSYRIGKRGFLHGAFIGLLYMIIVIIISMAAQKSNINMPSVLLRLVMAIVVGALSGMIGVVLTGSKN